MTSQHRNEMALAENIIVEQKNQTKSRVLLQAESKCLFNNGIKFNYVEVCIESCYL